MPRRTESEQRRILAWPLLRSMARAGAGSNVIYRHLREMGLGYRRKDVLQDIRLARLGLRREGELRVVPETEAVSVERYGTLKQNIGTRVMYRVMVALRHPQTRELAARWVNVKSSEYMTVSQIREAAREAYSQWIESASEGILRGQPLWQWHIEAIELSQVVGDIHYEYEPMEEIWEA